MALPLWEHLPCDERIPVQGWHEAAFSHYQIGYLARFWLDATAIRTQTSIGTTFSPDCIKGLEKIVADGSLKGDIGAAVLAGQAHFLLRAHQPWTEEIIQTMFTCGGNRERAAWGGLIEAQKHHPPSGPGPWANLPAKVQRTDRASSQRVPGQATLRQSIYRALMPLRARTRRVAQGDDRKEHYSHGCTDCTRHRRQTPRI